MPSKKEAAEKRYKQYIEEGRKIAKRNKTNPEFLVGIGVYWGEGYKTTRPGIANSDPDIIKHFLNFLKFFEADKKRTKGYLRLHSKKDVANVLQFWTEHLNVKEDFIKKVTFATKREKRRSKTDLKKGMVHINCYDIATLYRIFGAWKEVTGLDRAHWKAYIM